PSVRPGALYHRPDARRRWRRDDPGAGTGIAGPLSFEHRYPVGGGGRTPPRPSWRRHGFLAGRAPPLRGWLRGRAAALMTERLGYILLAIVWLCWGLSYPATAILLQSVDIWTSRVLVMPVSGIALLLVAAAQGGKLTIPRPYWRDLLILSVVNMSIFQICMTSGVALM